MPEPGALRLVPLPARGRTFSGTRRARFGDLDLHGRLRLDAVARYLQDVSGDDTADAGVANDVAWVVRRTAIALVRSPRFRECLTLTTACSGTGRRWAERRVSITGPGGPVAEAVSLWVHLHPRSGRPLVLPDDFWAVFGEAAAGREVSARLQHASEVPATGARSPWSLRATDLDLLGHVNNAATWAAIEEVLATRDDLGLPLWAELEYRAAIEPNDRVELVVADVPDGGVAVWLVEAPAGAVENPAGAVETPVGAVDTPRLFATAVVRPFVPD
jgi:acyl-ACP thioesterase